MPKIFGWILLIAGVVLIGWTLYYSFNIFTGKADLPGSGIFKVETVKTQTQTDKTSTNLSDLQNQIQAMIGDQVKGLLPQDLIPKTLNLTVWGILAWILIMGGGQLANLGIKLLKN